MCLPWLLTLIEPSRVFPSARLEYPLEEHALHRLAGQLGEYKLRDVQC